MHRHKSYLSRILLTCLLLTLALSNPVHAAKRKSANVPPDDEIEVLDPNADPLGRPAVELNEDAHGGVQVDIPPTVLVHKYYYTGDRSFQAQLLPGGPTIIVVNHPKTGERCYIETQMLPGAPRVTYTNHSIEYDYGDHCIAVTFPPLFKPKVVYRSGPTLPRRIGKLVHAEHWTARTKEFADRSKTMTVGAVAQAGDAAEQVVMPVKNLIQILPFGKILFSGETEERLTLRAAKHKRDKEIKRAQKQARRDSLTLRTVR